MSNYSDQSARSPSGYPVPQMSPSSADKPISSDKHASNGEHTFADGRAEREEMAYREIDAMLDSRVSGKHRAVMGPGVLPVEQESPVLGTPRLKKTRLVPALLYDLPTRSTIPAFSEMVDDDDDLHEDTQPTIPMMVLTGIAKQQGQEAPVMQSEISGAAGSAAIVGIGNIGGNILKYAGNLMIQRGFGAGPFGLFSVCSSIITLIVSVFNLGLDDAMVRYVSVYRSKQQRGLLQGLTIFCSLMTGIGGVIGAVLLMAYAPYLATTMHEPAASGLLLVMAPLIPLTGMQGVWSAGLQGFKAFKLRILSQRFIVPGALIAVLAVILIFYHSLMGVVVATFVSTFVSAVLCLFFFFRMVSTLRMAGREQYEMREWMGFAVPNFLTSIIDTVLEAVDTLLLAFFAVAQDSLGQYAAANKISIFISMPLLSLNVMFAPTIAELYSLGEKQKLSIMFKIVTKWSIIFSLPIFLIAVLFAKPLLGISGDDFVAGSSLLIGLSVGNMVNAATGSVGYMLTMTGYQKLAFVNSLVAVVINVLLGLLLTPTYGAMGVAVATGVAFAAVNLLRLLQVWFLLKIHPYQWDMLKPTAAGLLSAACTAGLLYLLQLVHQSLYIFRWKLSIELVLVPVFLTLYAVFIVLFRFSAEDKIVLDTLGKKIRGGKKK